jgi:hypothetical protein
MPVRRSDGQHGGHVKNLGRGPTARRNGPSPDRSAHRLRPGISIDRFSEIQSIFEPADVVRSGLSDTELPMIAIRNAESRTSIRSFRKHYRWNVPDFVELARISSKQLADSVSQKERTRFWHNALRIIEGTIRIVAKVTGLCATPLPSNAIGRFDSKGREFRFAKRAHALMAQCLTHFRRYELAVTDRSGSCATTHPSNAIGCHDSRATNSVSQNERTIKPCNRLRRLPRLVCEQVVTRTIPFRKSNLNNCITR